MLFCIYLGNKTKIVSFQVELGKRIKEHRLKTGLTLEQLGYEVGLEKGDVHKIERGKNITVLTALKLSIAMGIHIQDLFQIKYNITLDDLDLLVKSKKNRLK
ncbi:MAG: helix-turn-helix domain-containing protein [Bacteroidota bacterium]